MSDHATADVASWLRNELELRGYALIHDAGRAVLVDVLESLGRVLHVEEVVVTPSSTSLVKSSRGLSLHTDHHRADQIVWHCLAQSDLGGETVLADAVSAVATLPLPTQDALRRVQLKEHSVFKGDEDHYPLLSAKNGRLRVYYSYWLAESGLDDEARAAFEAFALAVESGPKVMLRLAPGDILTLDNGRMLHGRSPIEGSKERHLRRYWIESAAGT